MSVFVSGREREREGGRGVERSQISYRWIQQQCNEGSIYLDQWELRSETRLLSPPPLQTTGPYCSDLQWGVNEQQQLSAADLWHAKTMDLHAFSHITNHTLDVKFMLRMRQTNPKHSEVFHIKSTSTCFYKSFTTLLLIDLGHRSLHFRLEQTPSVLLSSIQSPQFWIVCHFAIQTLPLHPTTNLVVWQSVGGWGLHISPMPSEIGPIRQKH